MYRGAMAFDKDILAAALPTHLAECLRAAGAWEVDVNGNHVTCAGSVIGPAFSLSGQPWHRSAVANWRLTRPITRCGTACAWRT